jgi:hypothetical protein
VIDPSPRRDDRVTVLDLPAQIEDDAANRDSLMRR